MQKKIGILTFHNSINYGAILQAYSTQQFLLKHNYNAEVIDYSNCKISNELKKVKSKNVCLKYIKIIYKYRKKKQFNLFCDKFLNLSNSKNIKREEMQEFNDKYWCVITGSDQVWNTELTGNDSTYFLDFTNDECIRIGYSVSVGDKNNIDFGEMQKYVSRFDYISIREKSFLDNYNTINKNKADLCCDPTFLLEKKDFYNICNKRTVKEKYIFCFLMENKSYMLDFCNKLANELGYKVINNKNSLEFFLNCSPTDFLTWVNYAEIVVTDSFHGTVFSLIFGKKFITDSHTINRKIKTRIKDVLEIAKLDNHFLDIRESKYSILNKVSTEIINYNMVTENMNEYISYSKKWLLDAVGSKKNEK